ncbi:peptidyl-tRNA hydrolase II [Sparassis crispa]|uniref:peptidyl-tRNA hydrolase n=1 Tax=Sparassis crispa TaxID=139825 RepID=A0A401GF43_9APHY|nr:peptidyl-tRNA hydrolase II [Sparassis crispa]GBE80723.1 peptidyl-tRNA hydrolase II [Sparassis crispa]
MATSDTGSSTAAPSEQDNPNTEAQLPPLVMQIVVRRDLLDSEDWGVGPLMAQAAHATAAVLHETKDRPETQAYLDNLTHMRKVVLQTADRSSIERLHTLLASCTPPVPHHLWVEQPEDVPTCLALAPNRRESTVRKALDKAGCRLWKG